VVKTLKTEKSKKNFFPQSKLGFLAPIPSEFWGVPLDQMDLIADIGVDQWPTQLTPRKNLKANQP